jgi:hypothetical protein
MHYPDPAAPAEPSHHGCSTGSGHTLSTLWTTASKVFILL